MSQKGAYQSLCIHVHCAEQCSLLLYLAAAMECVTASSIADPLSVTHFATEHLCHPQVDLSHKAGAPLAGEAHPVRLHVATDLAQEGLSADDGGRWDVRSEVFNYEERMEWKKELGAQPARRCVQHILYSVL